jgi:hypothetical protein
MRSTMAYITAYKRENSRENNRRWMKLLEDDLFIRRGYHPARYIECWHGWRRPIFRLQIENMRYLPDFLALSRKYGQTMLLFWGDAYDVNTGRVLGEVREVVIHSKTKPEHPRWIDLGSNMYLLLETSVPLDLLDTLNAWSSGRVTPSDWSADLNHCLRA